MNIFVYQQEGTWQKFDVARGTRMDSRVGLIGGISTFFGDFVAFVAGLKVSFLCFFPSLKIDFQTMQNSDFSFHHLFCSRCCFIFHSLYMSS